MGARAYGVVGGAAVVVIALGLGSGTGVGSLGSIDPRAPLLQLPSSNPTPLHVASGMASLGPQPTVGLVVPDWVYSALTVLAAGVLLVLLGWFAWRVALQLQRGRRIAAAAASTEGTEVDEIPMSSFAETVDESLDDLRGGLDIDDVILECWRRLESLGEHAGAPRRDSDTSTEYVERLLNGVPQAATDLAVLARLYSSAMFSGLASDPSARATAIECLEHLSALLSEVATSGP
jgi:Domain of unknown function (DUF4129)